MAELEARFEKNESKNWRRPLPEGVEIKLGRAPGPDGWAADWDGFISSVHATLLWKDGKLRVRRRLEPRPTMNPIYYKAVENDDFSMAPNERFVIGGTTFSLLDASAPASDPTPAKPELTELTCSRQELRKVRFVDADQRMEALAALPEIIRYSPSEEELEQRVVRVLLEGIPTAQVAAIVTCLSDGTPDLKVGVQAAERRDGSPAELAPSRRLVSEALHNRRQGVLHVWKQNITGLEDSRFSLVDPKMSWAICIPLPDDPSPGWGLYIAGGLEHNLRSADSVAGDMQLKSDLKFAELAADVFGALRLAHHLQHRTSVLSTFLSQPVLIAVGKQNIEEVLQPREVNATVLFCDLRGSCKIVEGGQAELMDLWDKVSEALSIMTSAIVENDGVIGDFQGDAAMAFWGWPLGGEEQIERAARAALTIRRRFAHVARKPGHRLAGFACGLGIAHGPAIAGRIGTQDQFKVGVFGPVVNRAARLESLTRRFRVSTLLDDAVAQRLTGDGHSGWSRCRRIARLQPYGMSEKVLVSELLPPAVEQAQGNLGEPHRLSYEAALDAFMAGRWADVPRHLKFLGNDGPAEFLLNYVKQHPEGPPEGWDGVVKMESK
jgi:adenylate cyclase